MEMIQLPADRQLEVVLKFLDEDLGALTQAERGQRGWMLRGVRGPLGWRVRHRAITDTQLIALQQELRAGVRGFLEKGQWVLPVPARGVLERPGGIAQVFWEPDPASTAAVVVGVAMLVQTYAPRVRACTHCRTIFLANKRQQYCTPAHGQQVRDRKKASKKGKRQWRSTRRRRATASAGTTATAASASARTRVSRATKR
jgi:hypothetical protein